MKNKIALFVVIIMLITMIPFSAFAASHEVGDGEALNLATGVLTRADNSTVTYPIANGDIINVTAGATATITDSKNVIIVCGVGVDLTIDNVTIDVNATPDGCALSFSGGSAEAEHNTLTLVGTSTLTSGENEPGISVEGDTVLTISGSGSVTAKGGQYGAGIGGGNLGDVGMLNITGGSVTATGGHEGAGIGGGANAGGGTIKVWGGTVYAEGGKSAAGIGSGNAGGMGTIEINGGNVFATKGADAAHDIGYGEYVGAAGTLKISNTGAVFLKNDLCIMPATTHSHYDITEVTEDKVYGIPVHDGWMPGFGAYLQLYTLSYDANGGTGTIPSDVIQHKGTTVSVAFKGNLTNGSPYIGIPKRVETVRCTYRAMIL